MLLRFEQPLTNVNYECVYALVVLVGFVDNIISQVLGMIDFLRCCLVIIALKWLIYQGFEHHLKSVKVKNVSVLVVYLLHV